jgi:hypothetical protein
MAETDGNNLQLFENRPIRAAWDENKEEWVFQLLMWFGALTDSKDGRKYWNKLKRRLKEEGNELVTNCHQLKLRAQDGKMRLKDVTDTQQLLRTIQSVPSPKAEPFKMWLSQVGAERIEKTTDPEQAIERAENLSEKGLRRGMGPSARPLHPNKKRSDRRMAETRRGEGRGVCHPDGRNFPRGPD